VYTQLISTTLGGVTTQFSYNGDGARLRQVVAGVPTTYTQDLAAPLPVVLQSKTGATTTKYVYSLGTRPLAQNATAWEYLLPDALGSVRQIADANGNVTLAKSYEPYGSVLNSSGSATSIFGYGGEQFDSYIKLVFLRARYYSPETARFLSKDVWQGDYTRPQSLDAWAYTEGNPVNRIDPSGNNSWPAGELQSIAELRPYILDSARNHNTSLTNMDDNSFAALMAAILHWEGKLNGNGKPQGTIGDAFDPNTSSQWHDAAKELGGALMVGGQSYGIANIRIDVAMQILQGQIPGIPGTFCYQIAGGYDSNSLNWASFWSGVFGSWMPPEQVLYYQLAQPEISLEYLAANLQRGADRINAKGYEASIFNLASWHNQGVQTPEFIKSPNADQVVNGLSYANQVLNVLQDAFDSLGFSEIGSRFLPYNLDEAPFVKVSVPLPPFLPIPRK